MDFTILIPELLVIAKQAGEAILSFCHHAEDLGVEEKPDKSPVTLADKAANDIICTGLKELPVLFPIISEENKLLPFEVRMDWAHCWLVDPLDGTKEFINGNGDFTVNIALIESGNPVLGIVYVPCQDEMYWAAKNHGAFLIKDRVQTLIQATSFKQSDKNLNLVCSRSHLTKETADFIARFDQPNLVSRGSSLKFLMLAKGDAHVYPRIAPTMEWDTAAAQIILDEAGGQTLQFYTKEPLRYNKADLRNPAFIAYGRLES